MRVLHIITGLHKAAGTSVFCGELANELVAKGNQVTIAVLNPVDTDRYPLDRRVHLTSIASMFRLPSGYYDVVHIHGLWALPLHKISKLARSCHIPVVWSPHGMATPWTLRYKFFKKCLGLIFYQWWDLRAASALHVTAQSEAADMRRLCLKNPLIIAPLGVKMPKPRPLARAPDRTRTLLFVSRIQKKKGLPNLVRAWASIARAGWQVVIAGPNQEGHAKEIKALARKLGVETDFQFVGPVFGAEKERLYEQADLFVLPSYSENFGVVVPEALAFGCPVITTKGTPWAELLGHEGANTADAAGSIGLAASFNRPGGLVQGDANGNNDSSFILHPSSLAANGRCGWWIDIGVEPLAEALKEAMSLSDEDRRVMGENGRRLVEAKYTWPAIAEQMKAAYGWILQGGERPGFVDVV